MDEKQQTEFLQKLEELLQRFLDSRLRAVARATTNLADGMSSAEMRHATRDEEFQGVLVGILAALDKDPAKMSAEQVADKIPNSIVCKARQIQYQRSGGALSKNQLSEVVDGEIVHLHRHTEVTKDKRTEDDSIVFHTEDGKAHIRANIKAKTLAGWVFGVITFMLAAWHIIAEHLSKK